MNFMDFEQIGKRIKICRKHMHLTQEKLAERIDVSPHYIYELERGARAMSLYTLNDLANCLEVSIDYLLYGKRNTYFDEAPTDALSVIIQNLPADQRDCLADLIQEMLPYISLDEATTANS